MFPLTSIKLNHFLKHFLLSDAYTIRLDKKKAGAELVQAQVKLYS